MHRNALDYILGRLIQPKAMILLQQDLRFLQQPKMKMFFPAACLPVKLAFARLGLSAPADKHYIQHSALQ
jgi:hypothetical protein